MELFGIRVIDATAIDGAMQLNTYLQRWGLEGSRTGPLTVTLTITPIRQILLSWFAPSAIAQAAQIIARACDIPITRTFVGRDRDQVTVGLGGEDASDVTLWENIAWGIFLWAASRYPTRARWNMVSPSKPIRMVPPRPSVTPAVTSYVTQSLSLPRTRSVGIPAVPRLQPPAGAPGPRRGG